MNDSPGCAVCNKSLVYGGPKPYLLPCLHSVCNNCLTLDSTSVLCSNCGQSFSKSEYIFLKDTITETEVFRSTLKNKPSEIKCTNKAYCSLAKVWCNDCQVFFCKSCLSFHNQLKSSHSHDVVMVNDLVSGIPLRKESLCPEHGPFVLDFYDVTCEILICSKCGREEHKQCNIEELDAAGKEVKEVLEVYREKLQQKVQNTSKSLQETNVQKSESETRNKSTKSRITQYFNTLRDLVTQREQELIRELDLRQTSVSEEITNVTRKQKTALEKVKVAHDYTKKLLDHNTPEEFLVYKNNVTSRVEICLAEEVLRLDITKSTVEFSEDESEELRELIKSAGEIGFDETDDNEYINNGQGQGTDDEYEEEEEDQDDDGISNTDEPTYSNCSSSTTPLWPTDTDVADSLDTPFVIKGIDGNDEKDQDYDEPVYYNSFNSGAPQCPKLSFDGGKVNKTKVHISGDGILINNPDEKMFRQYVGTTSTTPLPNNGLSYWEVESDITIDKEMTKSGLLLEIGVVEGEVVDQNYCVGGFSGSRNLSIVHCADHKAVCAKIWNDGSKMGCKEKVLLNRAGTSVTLRHGVLFDGERNNLVFFDLNKMNMIEVLDTGESQDVLWPVFGLYNPSLATVKMRLVSGEDVQLTEEKLSLLVELNV